MAFLSNLMGDNAIPVGQETRRIPQEAAWGDVVCGLLEEDRILTIHALQAGELRAEHNPWPASADFGPAEVRPG